MKNNVLLRHSCMKTFTALLFMVLLAIAGKAQPAKHINIPRYGYADSTERCSELTKTALRLKVPSLMTCTDRFHFRIGFREQLIDIWTNDYITFYGQLTNYMYSYQPDDENQKKKDTVKTFLTQVPFDTATARQAYLLVQTVCFLPPQDSIEGWNNGCDGISYNFELSTPDYYSYKYYWEPSIFLQLKEAGQINAFINSIYKLADLGNENNCFLRTLPPGSYSADGFIVLNVLTKQQAKKYYRHKKRHADD